MGGNLLQDRGFGARNGVKKEGDQKRVIKKIWGQMARKA